MRCDAGTIRRLEHEVASRVDDHGRLREAEGQLEAVRAELGAELRLARAAAGGAAEAEARAKAEAEAWMKRAAASAEEWRAAHAWSSTLLKQALLTMALLTMALLTMASLTIPKAF